MPSLACPCHRALVAVVLAAGGIVAVTNVPARALAAPAAGPAAGAGATPAPKPPAVVLVRKSDGTSVRGQLAGADGVHLHVRPAEGKSFGEPIEVPWSQVTTVSNGLTRQKAHDAWKAEHKADLCGDCHGERRVACDTCKGTGHDPASSADCKTCKGELLVGCTEKRCDAGKVPCPAPCLKLTEGSWSKPDDQGKRWRSFRVGGGVGKVSDAHVGEIVKFQGGAMNTTPCEACGKTGSVTCPTCHGADKVACPRCKANKAAPDCPTCEAGLVACKTCGETGLKGSPGSAAPAPPAAPAAAAPPPAPSPAAPAPPVPAPQPPAQPAAGETDGF